MGKQGATWLRAASCSSLACRFSVQQQHWRLVSSRMRVSRQDLIGPCAGPCVIPFLRVASCCMPAPWHSARCSSMGLLC